MTLFSIPRLFRFTPFRIFLPTVLMILLFAGSIFFYLLPSMKTGFMNNKKHTIHELSGAVVDSLGYLNERLLRKEITEKQAHALGQELVRAMRYGPEDKDYFWINDFTPRMIMHPYRPDLDGTDLSNYTDKQGKALFVEFVKVVREHGGGFVDYYWQWKDQPNKVVRKLSYVREFEPWGWIIGTGIYLDDVQEEMAVYRNRITVIFLGKIGRAHV